MMYTEVKSCVFNTYENGVGNLWWEEKVSGMKPEAADQELFGLHVTCQESDI